MSFAWKNYIGELVATFLFALFFLSGFLVYAGRDNSVLVAALVAAFIYAAIFAVFNGYSGAHVNPVLTLAVALNNRLNWLPTLIYIILQFVGWLLAALLVWYIFGKNTFANAAYIGSLGQHSQLKSVVVSGFATLLFVLAFLFITDNINYAETSALILGGVLGGIILVTYSLIGVSSINPFQTITVDIFAKKWTSWWVYLVGPIIGALIAALVFWLMKKKYNCVPKTDECGNVLKTECGDTVMTCTSNLGGCTPVKDACGKSATFKYDAVQSPGGPGQTTVQTATMQFIQNQEALRTTRGAETLVESAASGLARVSGRK